MYALVLVWEIICPFPQTTLVSLLYSGPFLLLFGVAVVEPGSINALPCPLQLSELNKFSQSIVDCFSLEAYKMSLAHVR